MDEKPEALLLAEWLEGEAIAWGIHRYRRAAAELRRLHELNGELLEALRSAAIAIEVLGGRSERLRAVIAKAEGKT